MMRLLIALLATSCAPFGSTPTLHESFVMYQYTIDVPTKPVSSNERLKLAWQPRLAPERSPTLYEVQLCVALFGPWQSVEALKNGAPKDARSCPPAGASVTSETLRITSNNAAPPAAEIAVPSAPGFYHLAQIAVFGSGNATSAGAIIEVR